MYVPSMQAASDAQDGQRGVFPFDDAQECASSSPAPEYVGMHSGPLEVPSRHSYFNATAVCKVDAKMYITMHHPELRDAGRSKPGVDRLHVYAARAVQYF